MNARSPEKLILWAEDDENDALLFQRAFKSLQPGCVVFRVSDGEEVIHYLLGKGEYSNRTKYPLPQLLLLDVKMPRKGGFDVLQWRVTRPEYRAIPVVMLSSSTEECDRTKASELGAIEYFGKPVRFSGMLPLVRRLERIAQRCDSQSP